MNVAWPWMMGPGGRVAWLWTDPWGVQRARSGGCGVWAKSDTTGAVAGNRGDVDTVTHGMEAVTGGAAVDRASWGVGACIGERGPRVSKWVCVHVRS